MDGGLQEAQNQADWSKNCRYASQTSQILQFREQLALESAAARLCIGLKQRNSIAARSRVDEKRS